MAYVNFKEEISVAKKQFTNRKENNKKVIDRIKMDKKVITNNYDTEYSFKEIKDMVIYNLEIMKERDFQEIYNKNIICAKFTSCKFYNIKFKECIFIGCVFEDCEFDGGGVAFENCIFVKIESDENPSLNIRDNLSCEFNSCNLYIKFVGCDISYLIIDNCKVRNTSFENTNMTAVMIINSYLKRINLSDVDLCDSKILDTYIEDFEFNDRLNSKVNEKTFFDKIKLRKKDRQEYEGIYKVYKCIADEFKQNNFNNNFGEYYYLSKNVQRKALKPIPRFFSFIYLITSGYGERVIAPLISSLALIITFAMLYLVLGIEVEGQVFKLTFEVAKSSGVRNLVFYFNEALTLSVGMFAGIGMFESPPTAIGFFIANIEMVIGVIMTGIGIGTLVRKIIR